MDDNDVLDRMWQREGPTTPRVPPRPTPSERTGAVPMEDDTLPAVSEYQAFKAVDRDPFCLSIYTNGPANAHPTYAYYQYIADDGRGNIFDIVYAFFVVRVRGRNLLPVIHAIKSKKCVFIQQYQRHAEWVEPGSQDTVIEKIEIIHEPAARAAMLEKGGKAKS